MKGVGVEVEAEVETEEGMADPEVGVIIADIALDHHHQARVINGIIDQEVVIMSGIRITGMVTITGVDKGRTAQVVVVVQPQALVIIQAVKLPGEVDTTMVATEVVIAVMLNVLIMLLVLGVLEVGEVEVVSVVVEEDEAADEAFPEIEEVSNHLRVMIMEAILMIRVIIRMKKVMTMRVMKSI